MYPIIGLYILVIKHKNRLFSCLLCFPGMIVHDCMKGSENGHKTAKKE